MDMIRIVQAWLKGGQSGLALPMALVLLVAASVIVVPSIWVVQSMLTINRNVSQSTRAYYAAEAGVADLIWKYKYSAAPTASYILQDINGMDVELTPVKTSGQDYYWMSSAESGPVSKAEVYVHIRRTGAQGNNLFEYAVASLNGDVAMSGGAVINSDDVVLIDYCDSAWSRKAASTHISCSTVTSNPYVETNVYWDTTPRSSKLDIKNAAVVEALAYRNTTATNITNYQYISVWLYSTTALNTGDIRFMIATANALGGTVEYLDIPGLPANTGTRVTLPIANPAAFSAVRSIGVYQAVDKGAFILYVDNVIATNDISDGNIFANGSINLQPSAQVYGNGSATGSITVNTSGGAKIYGSQTPGSPVWTPQPIDINQYKNEANIKGGTVYPTLSTAWDASDLGQITVNGNANINWSSYNITMGPAWIGGNLNISTNTITMGPVYVVGDMTISGSSNVTLKGTVYVEGNLSISGGAVVQGPYTIVAKQITVSGNSDVHLDKGNIPFFIAYDGDFIISGSSHIAAVIYAPNGSADISGGTPSDFGYNIYGAVVAKNVIMSGSTTVKYMTGIETLPWPPGWGLGGGPAGGGGTSVTTVLGYDRR